MIYEPLYQGELYSEYLVKDIGELTQPFFEKVNADEALETLFNKIKQKGFKKIGIPHKDGERIVFVGTGYCIVEILHD